MIIQVSLGQLPPVAFSPSLFPLVSSCRILYHLSASASFRQRQKSIPTVCRVRPTAQQHHLIMPETRRLPLRGWRSSLTEGLTFPHRASAAFAASNADLLIRRISPASSFVKAKHLLPRSFSDAPIRNSSLSSIMRKRSWKDSV